MTAIHVNILIENREFVTPLSKNGRQIIPYNGVNSIYRGYSIRVVRINTSLVTLNDLNHWVQKLIRPHLYVKT